MESSPVAHSRRHPHVFDDTNPLAERNTRLAVGLTALMMVVEIVGGWVFNSMALLADGWHMSSHTLALGVSVLAYAAARRFANDNRFAFGTWKIEVLGGYTSAVLLVGVAVLMLYQSVQRLIAPSPISYDQAIAIAAIGLSVNAASAWLLKGGHSHHDAAGGDRHGHQDLNLRSAYLHVMADAATSVLAIVALFGARVWGADWLDPAMGIVGAGLVSTWAFGLLRDTGRALLDAEMHDPVVVEIREAVAACAVKADITDLHVWRVGKGRYACILALTAEGPLTPDDVRRQLSVHQELVHVTVEIDRRPRLTSSPESGT